MNTRDIYEKLKAAIDEAEKKKNYLHVIDAAEEHGLSGGETTKPMIMSYDYDFTGEDGLAIKLHLESYDTTKTFGAMQRTSTNSNSS